MPSRLFIYYNERRIEGTVTTDSGAMIRDGFTTINMQGVCSEQEWPYDGTAAESNGTWPPSAKAGQQPPQQFYTDALKNRAITYQRVVQNSDQMKGCLASGCPIVVGFTVYSSFESQEVAETGIVPMPQPNEEVLGGHAVLVVGYSDEKGCFLVRNSWGTQWGISGYFWMPYAYLTESSLSSDFWTLRIVS
jgi:C1A family cysteine protease